jgi:flagella basal body P-ring formation protein FlgA
VNLAATVAHAAVRPEPVEGPRPPTSTPTTTTTTTTTTMLTLLLPLLLAAAPTPDRAIAAALSAPGSRAEVLAVRAAAAGCSAESFEATGAVEASGDVPLRIHGRDREGGACEGAAWAAVRVFAPALVVARALREGEPLKGAVELEEREVRLGRPAVVALPEGAAAARTLRARDALAPADVRVGPRPGEPVAVLVRAGTLELERSARAVPCAREAAVREGRACALVPGGRRIEGRFQAGRILVEAP